MFMINTPAFALQQRRDPAVTVPTTLRGQLYDTPNQSRLITWHLLRVTLSGAGLDQYPTCPAFLDGCIAKYASHMRDSLTASGRAQKFGYAGSFRIALSNSVSASRLLSRAFSFPNSFKRFA